MDNVDDSIVEWIPNATETPNAPNGVYPGFRSIAIIAAIVISSVVLIVAADVSRKIIQTRRDKRTSYQVEEVHRLHGMKVGKANSGV